MEKYDAYSSTEYMEICKIAEKNMLLNPQKRDKYLKNKAQREKMEKIIKAKERNIEIMY